MFKIFINKIWKLWTLKNKPSDDKLFDIDASAFSERNSERKRVAKHWNGISNYMN